MTALTAPDRNSRFAPHPRSGRSRNAVIGTLWSLLHTLIPSLSAALIFFLSAAYLTPVDFGHLAIAAGVVSVALAFSPLAFGEALVQRDVLERSHTDAVFWMTALTGVLYCSVLGFAAPLAARWFDAPELLWLLPILALKVPFELMAAVPSAMIVRSMQFRLIALRTAMGAGVGAVVCVAMLLGGFGLLALAVSQVAVSATICVVAFWTSGWRPGLSGRLSDLRDLAHYGLFSSGQRMLGTLRLDHLVAGALAGPAFLGLLVFGQRVFRLLADVASGALSSVLHVVLASMQGEREKAQRTFGLASFGAAALGFPVFAGAALVIDDLVTFFFAQRWSEAAFVAQLYCAAGFIAALGIVQGALIRSQGRPDWLFWYQLGQEVTTVLVIALTWRFGLGVMVATIVVKTFLLWPISALMTVRLLRCSLTSYARTFTGPALATIGMAACVLALPHGEGGRGLLLQVTVGVVVYPPLLALFSRAQMAEAIRILRQNREGRS